MDMQMYLKKKTTAVITELAPLLGNQDAPV